MEFELGTDPATARKNVDAMVSESSIEPYELREEDKDAVDDKDWNWEKDKYSKGNT
jgi:hypothetical protein